MDFESIEARLLQYSADVDARAADAINSVQIQPGEKCFDGAAPNPASYVRKVLDDILNSEPACQPSTSWHGADQDHDEQQQPQATEGKEIDNISGLNSQSAIRLYKVKLSTATAQNIAIQEALKVKSKKTDKLEKELQELQKEKAGLEKSVKQLDAENAKLRKTAEESKIEIAAKEEALKKVTAALAQHESERRQSESDNSGRDKRLARALLDLGKYKQLVEEAKSMATNANMIPRAELDKTIADVRKLEKQKQELISAFRKQARLIDVLKRQKLHLEASRLLDFTEAEFLKVIELKPV